MADQAAVDAMSAALGDFAAGKIDEPVSEVKDEEIPTSTDEGNKDGADAGTEGEGTEGDEGNDEQSGEEGDGAEVADELPATEADISPRRPDGTFKKKEEIEAEKAAIKARDEAKAAGGDADKKPDAKDGKPGEKDPINDPIPEGLKKETRERMQSLVTIAKTAQTQIETQQKLFDAIADTGANADEFGLMLGYMRAVHSEKTEDLEFAHQILTQELRALAVKLGKPTAGVDLLSEHKDLQDFVEAGTLTRELASEVAVSRERAKQAAAKTTATAQATAQQTQAQTQAFEAGRQALTDLGETLAAVDPLYEAKKPLAIAALGNTLSTLPPTQWVAAFRKAYASVKVPNTGAAPVQKQQPLRTNKQPTGQGAKQPTNAKEAMDAALADKFGV